MTFMDETTDKGPFVLISLRRLLPLPTPLRDRSPDLVPAILGNFPSSVRAGTRRSVRPASVRPFLNADYAAFSDRAFAAH